MPRMNPAMLQVMADRKSWKEEVKTVNGRPMILVATQVPRPSRPDVKRYVYRMGGTREIFFNRGRSKIMFMRIAVRRRDMERYYTTFVEPPVTTVEQNWLDLYRFTVI